MRLLRDGSNPGIHLLRYLPLQQHHPCRPQELHPEAGRQSRLTSDTGCLMLLNLLSELSAGSHRLSQPKMLEAHLQSFFIEVPVCCVGSPNNDDTVLTCARTGQSLDVVCSVHPRCWVREQMQTHASPRSECRMPEGWTRMTAVPLGPSTSLRWSSLTPASESEDLRSSALASLPTWRSAQ